MAMKVVVFPPVEMEEAKKLETLLATMSEFMGVALKKTEVRVLQIEFPAERQDVATVLNKIAASKKKK